MYSTTATVHHVVYSVAQSMMKAMSSLYYVGENRMHPDTVQQIVPVRRSQSNLYKICHNRQPTKYYRWCCTHSIMHYCAIDRKSALEPPCVLSILQTITEHVHQARRLLVICYFGILVTTGSINIVFCAGVETVNATVDKGKGSKQAATIVRLTPRAATRCAVHRQPFRKDGR